MSAKWIATRLLTRPVRSPRRRPAAPLRTVLRLEALEERENPAPIQFFYVPMPATQVNAAFEAIVDPTNPNNVSRVEDSLTTITVTEGNTTIWYDQWEDGYEAILGTPRQASTQVWGDGNNANGIAPGFANDPNGIPAGTVIRLRNNINIPRDTTAQPFLFDSPDRFGADHSIAVSRAQFPTTVDGGGGSVIASAVEVRDTRYYDTAFTAPVGVNTPNAAIGAANSMFSYAALYVQAFEDGTRVQIDANNDGDFTDPDDRDVVIDQGQTVVSGPTVVQGARVVASRPVQADLLTGEINGQYASRTYALYSNAQAANDYFTPVGFGGTGDTASEDDVRLYVYNPNATAIQVRQEANTGVVTTKTVNPGATNFFDVTTNTGTRLSSVGGENFFTLGVHDGPGGTTDVTHDWGFSLQPVPALSQIAIVGLGIGNSANPPSSAGANTNYSPVWVTALGNTTLQVDDNGDGVVDHQIPVTRLQPVRLRDTTTNDNDNSGMKIYTLDGTLISVAWGEDGTAPSGSPGLDAGTTVPAVPVPEYYKFSTFAPGGDANGDGFFNEGDTIRYSLRVRHIGTTPISDAVITDQLPFQVTYVPGSTTINDGTTTTAIPDSPAGTAYPLDGTGYTIANIAPGQTFIVTFDAKINTGLPAGANFVLNQSVLAYDIFRLPANDVIDLRSSLGGTVWVDEDASGTQDFTDTNGNGRFDVGEPGEPGIPNVTVNITWYGQDGVLGTADDQLFTRVTDAAGRYLASDLPAGQYSVVVNTATLPANVAQTYDLNGPLDNAATVTLGVGQAVNNADFGYRSVATGSLGDRVWYDVNGNGVQDAGEPGIVGATVTVTSGGRDGDLATTADNITYVTTTGADGVWGLPNIPAGDFKDATSPNYRIAVTPLAGFTAQTYDSTAPTNDNTSFTRLNVGDNNTTQDFGYRGTGSIGDTVWIDYNRNGVQDAGEPGISGASVTLLWAGQDGTFGTADDVTYPAATTDGNGHYAFANLPPGSFRVAVDPASLPPGVGSGTFDPDSGPPTADGTADISLAAGQARTDIDFGFVGQADLQVTKTDGTPIYTPGGALTYTVVVTNAGPGDVTGATVTDTISSLLTGATWSVAFAGGGNTAGPTSGNGDINVTVNLPANATATFTINATVAANATGDLVNTATVTPPVGISDPTPGNNSATDTDAPPPTKSVVGTSEASSTGNQVLIGEVVRYRLVVEIPPTTGLPNFQLADALPAGLRFLNDGSAKLALVSSDGTSLFSNRGDLVGATVVGTTSNVTPTFALPAATISGGTGAGGAFQDGDGPVFSLGTLFNSESNPATGEFVVLEFNALVTNTAGNTGGVGRSNTFSVSVGGTPAGPPSQPAPVTVVEPRVSVSKTVSTPTADAGDVVDYTITLTNTGNATAFNLLLSDALPAEFGSAVVQSVTGGGLTTADFAITNGTLQTASASGVSLPSAAGNNTVTIVVRGTLTQAVTPNETISNTANVSYTSLPGPNGTTPNPTGSNPPGNPGTPTGERTYAASDTVTLTSPGASFAKSLFSTGIPQTTGTDVAVGEAVTYALRVTLPEGSTSGLTITDALPTGLQYTSVQIVTSAAAGGGLLASDFAGTVPAPTVTGGAADGDDVTFTFANIDTAGDNDPNTNTFLVLLTAQVVDSAANSGLNPPGRTVLSNSATFDIPGDGLPPVTSTSADVTVAEPRLTIAKDIVQTSADAGDVLTVNLTVSNTGTSPAFDTLVRDQLDPNLYDLNSVNFGTAGTNYPAGFAPAIDTNTGLLTYSGGTIAAGATATFSFTVALSTGVSPGQTVTNTADVRATSAPGTVPNDRVTTAGPATDSLTVPAATMTKSIASTSLPGTTGTDVAIGEVVTYALAITLPEGTTNSLNITDNLPAGMVEDSPATIDTTGFGGTVGPFGVASTGTSVFVNFSTITVNPDNDPTNNTFVVLIHARVDDVAGNGGLNPPGRTTLTNSASMQINGGPPTPSNTTDVTVAEPQLAVVKDVLNADTSIDAGTAVTYRVTISHTAASTGPAYNIGLNDNLLAAGLTLDPNSIQLAAPNYVLVASASDQTGLSLQINELRPGDTITITYTATLNGPGVALGTVPAPGSTVTNTASVGYSTAPTNGRTEPGLQDTAQVTVNTYSLAGEIYLDANNDGTRQAGEPLITGQPISLRLVGMDIENNSVDIPLTTNTGTYSFTGLRPGTYTLIEQTQPAGFTDGKDTPGTPFGGTGGGGNDADRITNIVIPANAPQDGVANAGVNYSFGELQGTSVGDFVWNDLNGNGVQDAGEPGIGGVAVSLQGTDDTGTAFGVATLTAPDGSYSFTGLRPGTYFVTFGNSAFGTQYARTVRNSPLGTPATDSDGDPTTGQTVSFTLTSGQTVTDLDQGLYVPVTIGDTVWYDINDSGAQDPGEPGVAGVNLTLTYAGPDGVFGTADDPAAASGTTTDANGHYAFTNLAPGTYRVTVDTTSLPAGLTFHTYDLDDGTGPYATPDATLVTVTSGADQLGADFGYRGNGFVGDTVFYDLNRNGLQDNNEPGIAGATVTFLWAGRDGTFGTADDVTYPTDTADAAGHYGFNFLPAGLFRVAVVSNSLPAGVGSATFDADSGPPNADGTADVTLAAQQARFDADFGFTGTGAIGDRVFLDQNANGTDDGEPGVPGVQLRLTWFGPDGVRGGTDDVVLTTTTDATGAYQFTSLPPGNYDVSVVAASVPPGLALSSDPDGTLDGSTAVTLAPAQSVTTADFGYRGTGSLAGAVYIDSNNNGTIDAGEAGIAGVTVTLTATDAFNNPYTATTQTGPNGTYSFGNLVPGTYRLTESQPAAYADGTDTVGRINGTPRGNTDPDQFSGIAVGPADAGTGYNFGERGASVGGRVFRDANRDGDLTPGETGIPGVTVTLADADGNTVGTTTTDNAGNYSFTDLPAGTYTVTESQPAGYGNPPAGPFAADSRTVTLAPGGAAPDQNFGDTLGGLGGTVYRDYNLSGTFDATAARPDTGVAGVTITLLDSAGNVVATATTDANGNYLFDQLPTGNYTIVETQPPAPSGPIDPAVEATTFYDGADNVGSLSGSSPGKNRLAVTLGTDPNTSASQLGTGYDFGEFPPADPFGFVYTDRNHNGRMDAGEPGIPGVSVTISGVAFAGTPFARTITGADVPGGSLTVVTDASGRWQFNPIPPGLYSFTETQPAGFVDGVEQDADPNGPPTTVGNDVFSNVMLAPFPARGPFNFGELLVPQGQGNLPPIEFFPQAPADFSKRMFLGSTPPAVTPPALPTAPDFAGFGAPAARATVYAVAAEDLGGGLVRVFDYAAGVERFRFSPFADFAGGVRVASADLTGDGIPDIITAAGPGGGPVVKVFDGSTGERVASFLAFDANFRGGLVVTAADFDGDSRADIVVTPDVGGGPIVRIFDGATFAQKANFFALDPDFRGGLRIAAGDVNRDGTPDLLVTAGVGGGPRVAGYDGTTIFAAAPGRLFNDFFAFAPELRNGFWVTAADVNGDGFADVMLGAGSGGAPRVVAYDGQTLANAGGAVATKSFFAGDPTSRDGVRIAAKDLDGDGRPELLAAAGGPGGYAIMSVYDPVTGLRRDMFYAFPTDFFGGVGVA